MEREKKTENKLTFDYLEKSIHEYHLQKSREDLKYILESLDKWLCENRDKELLKFTSRKSTTYKTIFGEVEISRRYYTMKLPLGGSQNVILLDEVLATNAIGSFTTQAAEKIRKLRDKRLLSYRNIALNLREACGIDVTRQAIPGVLFAYEEWLEKKLTEELGEDEPETG